MKRPRLDLSNPEWLGALLALAVLLLGMGVYELSVWKLAFFSAPNLANVLQNSSFVGLVAIGMTFVIILGGIDLSVGSLVALAGGVGVWLMNNVIQADAIRQAVEEARAAGIEPHYGSISYSLAGFWQATGFAGAEGFAVGLAFFVILLTGALAGLLNGVLIAKGRIAPFIATLGGLAGYRSLAQAMVEGGEFRSASPAAFAYLGTKGPVGLLQDLGLPMNRIWFTNLYGNPVEVPWPIFVFILVAIGAAVLLHRTRYGRHVVAIGCNETAARYSGLRVERVKIATYTLLGLLAGLAAMLNTSRMNSVSSGGTGTLWELDAIAAVVIGGTRMSGGRGTIFGTVLGLLILGVIGNMLNMLQVSTYLQGLVKGVIIVVAVLIQRGRRTT